MSSSWTWGTNLLSMWALATFEPFRIGEISGSSSCFFLRLTIEQLLAQPGLSLNFFCLCDCFWWAFSGWFFCCSSISFCLAFVELLVSTLQQFLCPNWSLGLVGNLIADHTDVWENNSNDEECCDYSSFWQPLNYVWDLSHRSWSIDFENWSFGLMF